MPLIQEPGDGPVLEAQAIQFERESVEDENRGITMLEAGRQDLIGVQAKDPEPGERTGNGPVEEEE